MKNNNIGYSLFLSFIIWIIINVLITFTSIPNDGNKFYDIFKSIYSNYFENDIWWLIIMDIIFLLSIIILFKKVKKSILSGFLKNVYELIFLIYSSIIAYIYAWTIILVIFDNFTSDEWFRWSWLEWLVLWVYNVASLWLLILIIYIFLYFWYYIITKKKK